MLSYKRLSLAFLAGSAIGLLGAFGLVAVGENHAVLALMPLVCGLGSAGFAVCANAH